MIEIAEKEISLDRMIQKKSPYERIDLLLFSHAHADHFNADLAVRVLEAHPETVLVGNDAVKDALRQEAGEKLAALAPRIRIFNPAWGTTVEETIAGVPLKMFSVNHADFPQEYQTLASITFQNYFRMYDKLAGMTGTADTEAAEFKKIYNLDVVAIPTNKTVVRADYPDQVYKSQRAKFRAVVNEIEALHLKGQARSLCAA